MSLWSDLPAMAEQTFAPVDDTYVERARDTGDHAIVAGRNYGQGSSREQAALAPRTLGLRIVLAESIPRIHAENLGGG
jgi:aconitate hydratase